MVELIHPNGQRANVTDPAQIAELRARGFGGFGEALAQNPGQTIDEIASQRGQTWNSPGGQGYQEAQLQGLNNPMSNPDNPPQQTGGLLGGGWGSAPGLQGLLSGYTPVFGSYSSYPSWGSGSFQGFGSAPSWGGPQFQPANTGSSILWTT